jgi:histidinol-phosphatase
LGSGACGTNSLSQEYETIIGSSYPIRCIIWLHMAAKRDALRVALQAARRAGAIALRGFGRKLKIERKKDSTPVTVVDRACEEELRRVIARSFPQDEFMGEEFGVARGRSGNRWIIDPIDGTKSFIRGIPFWGIMVAREEEGKLNLGVIYFPALEQTLYAQRGSGAFLDRRRLRVSRTRLLRDSTILHGDLPCFVKTGTLAKLSEIARRAEAVRGYSDCWGYSWLCQGRAEAVIEAAMHPWDVAAPKVIVEEAGGTMTDWRGKDSYAITNSLASNGRLHAALRRFLR